MDESLKYGIVGYTDGGASPNPGPTGAGIHIYHFHYLTKDETKPTVFGRFVATDRGYFTQKEFDEMKPKNKPSAVIVDSCTDICIGVGMGTNNVGEMTAMQVFMEHAVSKIEDNPDRAIVKVHAISDSELVISGVTDYIRTWVQRNWILTSGKPVANREIWEKIKSAKEQLEGMTAFSCSWVLGHNDEFGNVRADILASLGVNYSTAGVLGKYIEIYPTVKDFKQCDLEFHPFFCLQRVYFSSVSSMNRAKVYYQTNGGDDKFVTGKRSGEAAYSVFKLIEPDVLADGLISAAARDNDVNTVLYFRLDRASAHAVRQCYNAHKEFSYVKDKRNFNLNFMDKKPVVVEVKPGELPLRSIDTLEFLEDMLDTYQEHLEDGTAFAISGTEAELHDVTSMFYTSIVKGKIGKEVETHKLNAEHGVGAEGASLELSVPMISGENKLKFNLVFGLDLPTRNAMRRLEALHPMVQLVVWKTGDSAARYAVLIKTDEAIGIWSNYHANLLII